jgi:hypothetical protein
MSLNYFTRLGIVLTSLGRGGGDPGSHLFEGPLLLQDIPCSNFAPIYVLITSVAVGCEGPNEVLEWSFDATLKEMLSHIPEDSGRDCILVRLPSHTGPSHDEVGDHKAFCVTGTTDNSRDEVRTDFSDGPARSVHV